MPSPLTREERARREQRQAKLIAREVARAGIERTRAQTSDVASSIRTWSVDGEGRNRTGDITIFSRWCLALERRANAANRRIQISPVEPRMSPDSVLLPAVQATGRRPSPNWSPSSGDVLMKATWRGGEVVAVDPSACCPRYSRAARQLIDERRGAG